MVLEQLDIHRQKKRIQMQNLHFSRKLTKHESLCERKRCKILIDNIYKNLEDLGFGNDFSFITTFIDI